LIDSFLRYSFLSIRHNLTIVFTAPPQGAEAFRERCIGAGIEAICVNSATDFEKHRSADLFIDAAFEGLFAQVEGPLLFHCPALTFSSLNAAPSNAARFCAWPGFWERTSWEIATRDNMQGLFAGLLLRAGITAIPVADTAGLIAPRILCTIINEAAYTLAGEIACAADIDTAMKLGTNYPFGPAEWCRMIGPGEVRNVLNAMALENERYLPHPALENLAC
jgi:3-hydroxybutyryl-CoA dehydrogenase